MQCSRCTSFYFNLESSSRKPPKSALGSFRIYSKSRKWRCTTGINDTDGKFATSVKRWKIAACINDTSGKFATGVNDNRWRIMWTISDCCHFKVNLKKKIYLYANSTTQRSFKKIIKTFLIEDFFIFHQCLRQWWCTVSCEYLGEFSKNSKRPSGLGGNWFIKKVEISWHCPFNHGGTVLFLNAWSDSLKELYRKKNVPFLTLTSGLK